MPTIDGLAQTWGDSVDVIAVAWQSSLEDTADVANWLLTSGHTRWTLDEKVVSAFGVASQPVSVLVADGVEVRRWYGPIGGDVVTLVQGLVET